jgi:UDP:flavonoid glycosyltransferase YjiC (YdhE family)
MRYLVVSVGSHGDIHPLLGIAVALRDRGHDVMFLANGYFEPLVRRAGLEYAAIGQAETFQQALRNPDLWHPLRGGKAVFTHGVLPSMRPTYEAIAQHVVPGRTILIAHGIALGARAARDKLNVPLITTQLQPAIFRTVHDFPTLPYFPMRRWMPKPLKRAIWWYADVAVIEPVLRPPINAFLKELDLPPVKGILKSWWHSPDLVLALFPEWFAPPQPDWPSQVRLTGFPLFDERGLEPLPAELEAFLDGGEPPIMFTPGSAMTFGHEFFNASAEACRLLGRRGLLLTRHTEQVPKALPPGVRHFAYAPFSQTLPRCCASVHHGGIGTTAQALAAGKPQLIMPMAHDQFDNAARIERLGVGRSIRRKRYQAKNVAESLDRLLGDESVAAACGTIILRFHGVDALASACEEIEAFAARQATSSNISSN